MTPAINYLKQHGIHYQVHQYYHDKSTSAYGLEAVEALGLNASVVFKTLVVAIAGKQLAVAVLPVENTLSMKKLAKAFQVKKVAMAKAQDVERTTGYVLGGVSPVGQKNRLPTVLHESALGLANMFVSAGKRGLEIELAPSDLQQACNALWADIIDVR